VSDCEQLIQAGPYVLGALDPAEFEAFERHVALCAACTAEVANLRPAADALGSRVPPEAMPAELRERIMYQVRSEAELLAAAGSGADRPAHRPARPHLGRRGLAGFGAAVAAACGVAVGIAVAGGGSAAGDKTVQALVERVSGRAELIEQRGHADLEVTGLPQPPPGRIYQVWVAGATGAPRPTNALFSVDRTGNGSTTIPVSLRGVKRVMVTAEPLGGSSHPTSAPVIIATI
jgi:anti-sigma-K factor RskA